jgi:glycosyltransferase involved in cell wall biosynthesis
VDEVDVVDAMDTPHALGAQQNIFLLLRNLGASVSSNGSNPTIAFDTWVLSPHLRHHGVHVYGRELLRNFRELSRKCSVEVAPFCSRGDDDSARIFAASPGFHPRETRLLERSRLWRFGGAWALASWDRPDVVFSPQITTLYLRRPVPIVTTIHDVIPLVMPWKSHKLKTLRFLLRSAVSASRSIITVSQHSKADLINVYGLPESRISVVYNGYDHELFNDSPADPELLAEVRRKHGIRPDYILHHGVIKPSKNLHRLIQAYRLLLGRNRELNLDLVLAGPLGWEYEDVVATAQEQGKPGRVILTGALSQQDLLLLLKGATLAVIPSLYEGFCMPMIEAMACGVPTIAANGSCLPEISGGALLYFDPHSEEEMSACMGQALENDSLRRELSAKGTARAQQFGWRRCAEETLAVLASVAREGGRR